MPPVLASLPHRERSCNICWYREIPGAPANRMGGRYGSPSIPVFTPSWPRRDPPGASRVVFERSVNCRSPICACKHTHLKIDIVMKKSARIAIRAASCRGSLSRFYSKRSPFHRNLLGLGTLAVTCRTFTRSRGDAPGDTKNAGGHRRAQTRDSRRRERRIRVPHR